jgi:Lon protease-like protein
VRELPDVIPLFPLPNVVLMPRMVLPLHIFEQRYREMVAAALDGPRLIGMVLLRGNWRRDYYGHPDIFPTGTVGIIREHEPLADGRCNILLMGLREFTVAEEHLDRTYRYAGVSWRELAPEPGLSAETRKEIAGLVLALERRGRSEWGKVATSTSIEDEILVNALSQGMDFSPLEKLWLLEAGSIAERATRLKDLLAFRVQEVSSASMRQRKHRWAN